MDFRDQVFIKVAENLSFSKAAKELFISQPAVTKHIKELESKLQTTLFHRKGNKIYLTESGKLTYDFLKRISLLYSDLYFNIGVLNNSFTGKLRIGASSTISQYLLPKLLAAFHKKYPDIELFMYNGNSDDMEKKLLNHQIDVALVENESSHPNLYYKDFLDDELVVVTGSNSVYAKMKQFSINDLYEIPLVLREKGSGTLQVIEKALARHNINPDKMNILIHLGSTEAIKNFLYDFNGIGIVSEIAIEKELRLKDITKIPIQNFKFHRKFRIALRRGEPVFSSKLFTRFMAYYNM